MDIISLLGYNLELDIIQEYAERLGGSMRIKNEVIIITVFIGLIIGLNNISYASSQQFYSMDFSVNINEDGSMEVVELWDMYINKGSTAYKEFILDENKYGEIKDVSVKEITQTGVEKTFINIDSEMQKVTPNYYYALINNKGNFEIAWGTGLEYSSGRKTYRISYTVTDVIKAYNDCNEFCWKFIGYDHSTKVDKVTVNIYLPSEVENINNLRAWAHGPLNGNINIQNNKKVSFDVTDVYANEAVEIRIAVLEDIFTLNTNKSYVDNFNNILQEEQQFANEANKQREIPKDIAVILQIVIIVIFLLVIRNSINEIKKAKKELDKTRDIEPTEKYKYYRELLGKNMTAGDIGFIYYYKTGKFRKRLGRVFSANVLSLFLKRYINIFKDKKGDLVIEINKKVEKQNDLERDEREVLNIFISASRKLKTTFTMKEFKKYIKNLNSKKMLERFDNIEHTIERNARNNKVYTLSHEKIRDKYKHKLRKSRIMLIFMFLIIPCTLINTILTILLIIYLLIMLINISIIEKVIKRNSQLTQKGTDYLEKIEGLKRYIEDFSLIKEKETLDVVLWREYLICAVVLGVSRKIVKEIMEQMPEVNFNDYTYYWHDYDYLDKETSKIPAKVDRINRIQRFKDIANSDYSSGEGYGGGFSIGDAGGGRRWRIWRKIN